TPARRRTNRSATATRAELRVDGADDGRHAGTPRRDLRSLPPERDTAATTRRRRTLPGQVADAARSDHRLDEPARHADPRRHDAARNASDPDALQQPARPCPAG